MGLAFAPPANGGLSFVGMIFANQRVAHVQIISGNTPLETTVHVRSAASTISWPWDSPSTPSRQCSVPAVKTSAISDG
jgi:hypothetical protein